MTPKRLRMDQRKLYHLKEGLMSKSRFEAFTDGVFAVAITLLVVEVKVPEASSASNGSVIAWLHEAGPSILMYILSFLTVGVIWLNHHATYKQIKYVDRTMNLLNLILLMTVCFVPFPTALLARFGPLPASCAFYGTVFFLMGASYGSVWQYSAWLQHRIDPSIPALTWQIRLRGSIGTVFYLAGVLVSFWMPVAAVVIYVCVTIYYLLPGLFRTHHDDERDLASID